jgi:hypothetical protein
VRSGGGEHIVVHHAEATAGASLGMRCGKPSPIPPAREVIGDRERLLHRAAEPIELPHAQRAAGPQVVQRVGQPSTVAASTGELVLEHAVATGVDQGIALQLGVLRLSRYAGVADERARFRAAGHNDAVSLLVS